MYEREPVTGELHSPSRPMTDQRPGAGAVVRTGGNQVITAGGRNRPEFALVKVAVAAAPDVVKVALNQAIVEVPLGRVDVSQDCVLAAVHFGVVQDETSRRIVNHQRFRLRTTLRRGVNERHVLNRRCRRRIL